MKPKLKRAIKDIDAVCDPGNARGKALISAAVRIYRPDPHGKDWVDATCYAELESYLEARGYVVDPIRCTEADYTNLFFLYASVMRYCFTHSRYDKEVRWVPLFMFGRVVACGNALDA